MGVVVNRAVAALSPFFSGFSGPKISDLGAGAAAGVAVVHPVLAILSSWTVIPPLGSSTGHHTPLSVEDLATEGEGPAENPEDAQEVGVASTPLSAADEKRFQQLAVAQMDFVWRCLRRLGVIEADADDALQQVLLVAHAKLLLIPEGRERAFLFATAARIAANARRSVRRREAAMEQAAIRPKEPQVDQESLSEQLRARATLDEVLAELPEDLRQVFVLFEIEEIAIKDMSEMLELPIGTVGSKLRRARKAFSDAVKRYKAKQDFTVGARHE